MACVPAERGPHDQAGFNPTMVRLWRGVAAQETGDVFEVLIPQWFDCGRALPRAQGKHVLVSIPQWFDCGL